MPAATLRPPAFATDAALGRRQIVLGSVYSLTARVAQLGVMAEQLEKACLGPRKRPLTEAEVQRMLKALALEFAGARKLCREIEDALS